MNKNSLNFEDKYLTKINSKKHQIESFPIISGEYALKPPSNGMATNVTFCV